jgi:large subunit ribosomal protein L46
VLLSRPPLLTRELTPFEKSYYLYQRRLNERLALPFTRYFYYQKGTPGDVEWKRKIKERRTPARDIGAYSAYGDEGWNDELLVGDRVSEPEEQTERLVKDAEVEVIERDIQGEGEVVKKEEIERPMPRITEDDKNGNLRSLTRRLERTLYLVVTRDNTLWEFPTSLLEAGKESLHTVFRSLFYCYGIRIY